MINPVCGNCLFAKFPHGNSKIKDGTCFKNAGNDILPLNIMKSSKACEHWAKKRFRIPTHNPFRRKENTRTQKDL